jgi:membrane protein
MAQAQASPGIAVARARGLARVWIDAFAEHNLLTYASAIAFQTLIGAAALGFLFLALLKPLGASRLWTDHMAPAVAERLAPLHEAAVGYSVTQILNDHHSGLIAIGTVIAVWEVSGAMRATMGAMNRVYGAREERSVVRRFAISLALAAGVSALVILAVGAALGGGLVWSDVGLAGVAGTALSWLAALVLLWLVIALVVRVGPAQRQPWRWVSVGSGLAILAWVVISLAFRVYVADLAPFRSPEGALVSVLALTGYLYASAIAFLVGIELDQLLRSGRLQRV